MIIVISHAFAVISAVMGILPFASVIMPLVFVLVSCNTSEEVPSVKILVVGKTGSGKSTLINTFLGKDVAEVGKTLKSKTRDVECYRELYKADNSTFKVIICDSPGFRDNEFSDEKYMKMLRLKCHDPDLMLFIVSLRETRWTADQVETINKVNDAMGKEIWQNSVLVLSFANEENDPKRKNEFQKEFIDLLHNISVSKNVIDTIPVALAGKKSEGLHLPKHGVQFWFTQLFIDSLEQVKKKGTRAFALLILLQKNTHFTEEMKERFCSIVNNRLSKFHQFFIFSNDIFQ